ncbi:hypothetical protein P4S52_08975 [Vibrio sp. SA48]
MGIEFAKLDRYCMLFLVVSLFFSGANVYALAYPILKLFVFSSFLFLFAQLRLDFSCYKKEVVIQFSIALIFIWFICTLLSSAIYVNDDLLGLVFRYAAYLLVLFFLLSLKSKYSYLFFSYYSYVLFIIVIFSFISYVLSLFQLLPMVELVSAGGRVYLTTFFNIAMLDSKVTIGGVTFYRFQSIFEEPGTFSFLLLPAIYWYKFIEKKLLRVAFLSVCLIATLSVGSIIPILFAYSFYLLINKPAKAIPMLSLLFFLVIVAVLSSAELAEFLAYKFGLGIYEGQHTSMGVRMLEVKHVIDTLSSKIIGTGFSASNILDSYGVNIAVGLFRSVIYAGAVGGCAIILLNVVLGCYAINCLHKNNCSHLFLGYTLLAFLFMGLQRSTFIDGFLFVAIFSFLLKFTFIELKNDSD